MVILYVESIVHPYIEREVDVHSVLDGYLEAVFNDRVLEFLIDNDDGEQWLQKAPLGDVEELWLKGHHERLRQQQCAFNPSVSEKFEGLGRTGEVDRKLLVLHE